MTGWERVQWITLALIPRLGRRTLERLLAHFGSLDAVLSADDAALKAVPRIGAKTAAAIRAADPHATAAALDDWQAAEISALLPGDDAFPARLAALDDSPAVLFWRGSALPDESTPTVAIVGTRRPTRAAREMAIALAETLESDGWAVVSGLALGIDRLRRFGPAVSAGALALLLAFQVGTIVRLTQSERGLQFQLVERLQIPTRYDAPLIDFLTENGYTHGYASYWTAYRIAFRSHEQVVLDSILPYMDELVGVDTNRYPPYVEAVAAADRVVWITQNYPALDRAIEAALAEAGVRYRVRDFGPYRVYYDLSRRISPRDVTLTLSDEE